MARVASIKALEQIADQADERGQGRGAITLPGLQIVIVSPGATVPPRTIGPTFPEPAAIPHQTVDHEPAR